MSSLGYGVGRILALRGFRSRGFELREAFRFRVQGAVRLGDARGRWGVGRVWLSALSSPKP